MESQGKSLLDPERRKLFLIINFLTLTVLILARYFIVPLLQGVSPIDYLKITNTILDQLIVVLFASISISLLIILLIKPGGSSILPGKVYGSRKIKSILDLAFADDIQDFYYIGHNAKWTRSKTIKRISEYATVKNRSIKVFIVILDPSIVTYAKHIGKINFKPCNLGEDIKKLHLESFATIISMNCWNTKQPKLKIQIGLTDEVSYFRLDVFSKFVVISHAPQFNAPYTIYHSDSDEPLYNLYREEAVIRYQQSRPIKFPENSISFDNLSCENIKKLLSQLNFELDQYSKNDFEWIKKTCKAPISPY